MTPVEPKPAASVVLVRAAGPESGEPIEAYVIRRHARMRFLGGYYAFPGGKIDLDDCRPETLARCRGLTPAQAEAVIPSADGVPALAYWVAAARELIEETGLLLACDAEGRRVDPASEAAGEPIERVRAALVGGSASLVELLGGRQWFCDVASLRYLSHFITPASSPIRFSARFFLARVPPGQSPRLFAEETSEGFWIGPAAAVRRFRAGTMPMAEPAEYAFAYLAQFDSLAEVWAAHADGRHKFHGIIDRSDVFYGESFDWGPRTGASADRSPAPDPPSP
jgi:8-oxo-dGTP pyrophosphatase MutT (NUDIX family)